MKLFLLRTDFQPHGIFGELSDGEGKILFHTLEHSFEDGKGGYVPKVAVGFYNCVRHAPNRLPYETFMVDQVSDFQGKPVTGILFHVGNFDKDSEGCILVGHTRINDMVTASKTSFAEFMDLQTGLDSFELVVN